MTARVLVAGVGNIFLNDDGFGVEVVRRLAAETLPDWVDVADYGIRGMHLAYDVTSRGDGLETMILVDAMARGEKPGTVSVLEVDPERPADYVLPSSPIDAHGMQPDVVLDLITLLGGKAGRVLVVGCEPAELEPEIGLTPAVAAAVPGAVEAVKGLIREHDGSDRRLNAGSEV
ncbi:hydrogenase maturation protease [Fodinicola feengrottensis]|uniref:Hydrogenase maturation protease n=1 Tax=Fodinicola feengrottensis TaxID=435914 RepID=A0ABN2I324_9ACTN